MRRYSRGDELKDILEFLAFKKVGETEGNDLSEVDLNGETLIEIDFCRCNLDRSNFYKCDLSKSNLRHVTRGDRFSQGKTLLD